MDAVFFASPDELRAWLEEHAESAAELWVGFYKTATGRPSITWPQAVDEALCAGWIDGVRKRIDDSAYAIRFTPRKPGSIWSQVNIRRVEELTALGRVRPAGHEAFAARDGEKTRRYSYENARRALDPAYEATFRANAAAWTFFAAQAPSYRKVTSFWVMSGQREATRQKRLATLIADSAAGHRLDQFTRSPKG